MTVKRARIAALAATLAATLAAAHLGFAVQAWAKDADPVAATVDGHVIRLSDVESARGLLPPQMQDQPLQAVYPVKHPNTKAAWRASVNRFWSACC